MGPGRYLVESHLREGRSVAELARTHGIHRSWLYKLLARYRAQGQRGLEPGSRRPHRSPTKMSSAMATRIVRQRRRAVEIVNILDDHSRLLVASRALPVATAPAVAGIFQSATRRYGAPAALLTDNGRVFSAEDRGWKVALEADLGRTGIAHRRARPYHPQTCGKVERLHQTMKRYLAKQPRARTLSELQVQLDRFRLEYNERRPHRALGRHTPAGVYRSKVKATPPAAPARPTHFRVRHDQIDAYGKLTLRVDSRLHHIGLGARHRRQKVVLLIADRDVRILTPSGELLRHLTPDPRRDYQRQDVAV